MSVKGSFSVHFTWDGSDQVLLNTDITAIAAYGIEDDGYSSLSVSLSVNSGFLNVSTLLGGSAVDTSDYDLLGASSLEIWIFIYSNTISVYCNGRWVYSYVTSFIKYIAYATVASLVTNSTLTNIRREEIPDWRDAVYVDYESTGDNALQSIYQQRPVWMFPTADRELSFTYHTTKDVVPGHHIWSYDDKHVDVTDAASDGLVYYYDVGISTYPLAAKELGLVTRLYRLSELDIGGVEAARTIQEIALEHMNPVEMDMRLDPSVEISDRISVDLIVTGTGTNITDDVIVEDTNLSVQNGNYAMHITGRRNK
jgi:hypothetical protein